MKYFALIAVVIIILFCSFHFPSATTHYSSLIAHSDTLLYPEEVHFKNMRQLTFGGDNAEAYWSFDGKYIVFQRTAVKDGIPCDRIFYGKVPKAGEQFTYQSVSTGKGRTTCAFFTRDNRHIVYASTHEGADTCPPVPDRSKYGNK